MKVLPVLVLLLLALPVRAQPVSDGWPKADSVDVASVDAIMAAVYDAISGPAGPRDWDRFRSLFRPEAKLIPIARGGEFPVYMGVDEYVDRAGPSFMERAFFEREIHRTAERYGAMVHLFSTYESYDAPDSETPFARGINSFQLMYDGGRWWVVNIYWLSETEETPTPERYLPQG